MYFGEPIIITIRNKKKNLTVEDLKSHLYERVTEGDGRICSFTSLQWEELLFCEFESLSRILFGLNKTKGAPGKDSDSTKSWQETHTLLDVDKNNKMLKISLEVPA